MENKSSLLAILGEKHGPHVKPSLLQGVHVLARNSFCVLVCLVGNQECDASFHLIPFSFLHSDLQCFFRHSRPPALPPGLS